MKELIIRRATINDLVTLKEFEQGLITAERSFNNLVKPDPVCYYALDEMLTDADIDFVIGEMNDTPVACGYSRIEEAKHYYQFARQAYLGMMYVLPAYRGLGINAAIMNALKEKAEQRGVRDLCLEVFSSNSPAINAYKKAGFNSQIVQMRMSLG